MLPPPQDDAARGKIEFDSTGFTLTAGDESSGTRVSVSWKSVAEAIAFKRDLFSVDLICISFRLEDGIQVEIDEEMEGWSRLCGALPDHLPGSLARSDWFPQITTPAFAPCETCLFRRDP